MKSKKHGKHLNNNTVYSASKHKIIKGPFGSGKTKVAQKILKLVINNTKSLDIVCYIFHDTDSCFVWEMTKLANSLNSNNLKCCKCSNLIGSNKLLTSVLQYLLETNQGITIHVFIEEFNEEILDLNDMNSFGKRRTQTLSHIISSTIHGK